MRPSSPKKRSSVLASAGPLKRKLAGIAGSLRRQHSSKSGAECSSRERSPAPSLPTASTRSDLSDASHLSELTEDFPEEALPLPLPFFEDEGMHLRWGAALAGRQPWELSAEELRPLLAGGMPLKHRLALWPRWFSLPPGAVGRVEELCGQASGAAAAQIELDMPRTHPQWPLGDAARHTLRRVLLACAARYPEVGYCQGMGHMAATLIILGFDEDPGDRSYGSRGRGPATGPVSVGSRGLPPPSELAPAAFCGGHLPGSEDWATAHPIHGSPVHLCAHPKDLALRGLCSLMESCCEGYHDAGLSGWRQDANVLGELATRTLSPEALRRLQVVDVPLEVLASEHFLTVGSRSWPLEAALRLWDLALLDGPSAVFCSFLALLELFLPSVQGEADLEAEPVELFRERALLGLAENPVEVLECTQRIMEEVPRSLLGELRSGL